MELSSWTTRYKENENTPRKGHEAARWVWIPISCWVWLESRKLGVSNGSIKRSRKKKKGWTQLGPHRPCERDQTSVWEKMGPTQRVLSRQWYDNGIYVLAGSPWSQCTRLKEMQLEVKGRKLWGPVPRRGGLIENGDKFIRHLVTELTGLIYEGGMGSQEDSQVSLWIIWMAGKWCH